MAEHRWSLLCKGIDPLPSGNLNIAEVVDEIQVTSPSAEDVEAGKYAVDLKLKIASLWQRDDWAKEERAEVRLVTIGPKGDVLGETEPTPIDLDTHALVRVYGPLHVLPLHGFGVYRFRVEKRGDASEEWRHAGGDVTLGVWKKT